MSKSNYSNIYYDQSTFFDDSSSDNLFRNDFDRLKIAIPSYAVSVSCNYFRGNNIKDRRTLENKREVYSVPKAILSDFLGINSIDHNLSDDLIVIDITGKINASEGNLGLINSSNIHETLQKVIDTELVYFDIELVLDTASVFYCDVTKDIRVEDPQRSISSLKLELDNSSSRYKVVKYETGILVKTKANSTKDCICFYSKYDEIVKKKNWKYFEAIGEQSLDSLRNVLRVERHIGALRSIRRAFGLSKRTKLIPLMSVLNCREPVIFRRFEEIGLKEEKFK